MCKGKSHVKYADGRADKLHVIHDGKGRPLYACRKDEVEKLFDSTFWCCFEAWQYYHNGLGLPNGNNLDNYDPNFINIIMQMEMHYKNNFSLEIVMVQYLETIIKRMDNFAKGLSKRR